MLMRQGQQLCNKSSKVLAMRGKKAVASPSSAERGSLVTEIMCMSATSISIPPQFVFPRTNMKRRLLDTAPARTAAAYHPSGWILIESFNQWFKLFIDFVKATPEDPVLLLDGHYSHTRNIDLIDLAREKDVSIAYLPPHYTHTLQPLDVAFDIYYAQGIEKWLKMPENVGRGVLHYQVAALLRSASQTSCTCQIAANGFFKTGHFPVNRHVFDEHEFTEVFESNVEVNIAFGSSAVYPLNVIPIPQLSKSCGESSGHSSSRITAALVTGTPIQDLSRPYKDSP